MNRAFFFLALLTAAALTTTLPAGAADTAAAKPPSEHHRVLQILTADQIDPARLLPPPDADGSELQKADLARVQEVYRNRSPERRAQAEWDDTHESIELFNTVLGPQFDLAKLPLTARLMGEVDNDQSVATNIVKRYFLRKRPWAIDPSLVACDYKPNAAPLTSYPSGHATLSYSTGFILAALMPNKAQAILARAKDYAWSRVVCGAHYESDIEASHVLGTEFAMMMLENPAFHAQFETARQELRAAGLTGEVVAGK
jgi:acid phosphatase (class A)